MEEAAVFNIQVMERVLEPSVVKRFQANLLSGGATPKDDKIKIETALFEWAAGNHKATSYAHWFFPTRGGGGALGSSAGIKYDGFIDMRGGRIVNRLPKGRLFCGETDGSSFPNGGLRGTPTAAAYTAWDRASWPFVHDGTLYIPTCLTAYNGAALDDKTPLLRAQDAVQQQGLRLLNLMGGYEDTTRVLTYLGWEQEFYIISRENFLKRPDLQATGRTLVGAPALLGQQVDQNYFSPMGGSIKACMEEIREELLKVGCPLNVFHNEVAPGQHEISPIFSMSSYSVDQNQIAMQICAEVSSRHGLVTLFHEKPFQGLNGSGKHNNWSVGTNTGINFFEPGGEEDSKQYTLFVTALACLTYAIDVYNEEIRCSVATVGNDLRLGGQEAPPAILSLNPGKSIEGHVQDIINGGGLERGNHMMMAPVGANKPNFAEPINANLEDRNRTSPIPWCGNRFEFRAVGSAQNCGFPMAVLNTAFAAAMSALSGVLESGTSLRDAVADMFQKHHRVIFCGDGYSNEWTVEAERRGLPNLKDTVAAADAFTSEKSKNLFASMNVMSAAEVEARQEIIYDNFFATMNIEALTMTRMVQTEIMPAVARDLRIQSSKEAPRFEKVYDEISSRNRELQDLLDTVAGEDCIKKQAHFMASTIKPKMAELRSAVDSAELLCDSKNWPYPDYTNILREHHV